MHDGERLGLWFGELFQVLRGVWCVGHILREDARLIFLHRLMRAAHDIGRAKRFDVPVLMEQVRTEQCSLRFFKEDASVPAVGQMGSLAIAKAVLPRRKGPAVSEGA